MVKRIVTLLLSVVLLAGLCVPVLAAETDPVLVVNAGAAKTAEAAGLTRSNTYKRGSNFTLWWGGDDLTRKVTLPVEKTDWSAGSYLEFWAFSPIETASSFCIALISDDAETQETDAYVAVVDASFKDWRLISIPFSELQAVGSPKGMNSIDKIELLPTGETYRMESQANLYLNHFYVTKTESSVKELPEELVLFDFSTREGFQQSGLKESKNKTFMKAPEKETMAVRFTDADDEIDPYQAAERGASGMSALLLEPPTNDLTGYNTLEITMYSEAPTTDSFRIVFRSDNEEVNGHDYYYYNKALDWEGWKTLQISIDAFGRATNHELGWTKINIFDLWWYESEDKAKDSVTYIESVVLKNVDPNLRWENPLYLKDAPKVKDEVDVAAVIKENFPNNQHPRLLITQNELDYMKENWQEDVFLSKVIPNFLAVCDTYVGKPISMGARSSCTSASRAVALALAWKLTGDQKYADSCWDRVKEMTYDASSWAYKTSGVALAIGDTTRDAAIVYDLMYHDWTEEQRKVMRNAMILYAMEPMQGNLLRINGGQTDATNWTPIVNSGLGITALALADEPGYENVTNQFINRLHLSNAVFFQHFGPDGAGHEGPDYWNYMMGNYMEYEKALYRSLGSENSELFKRFSMTDEWGLEQTAEYITHMHGTTGTTFNYYDGDARGCHVPAMLWLAYLYGKPEQGGLAWGAANASADSILMYEPSVDYSGWRERMPLDASYGGEVQVGAMRTSWEAGNKGFFVGYKGNNANQSTHDRLDAGTFVLENQGQRFIVQIDDANYDLPYMFGDYRFRYYRNRAEGSNTLVIGPGVHQGSNLKDSYQADPDDVVDQVYECVTPIEKTKSNDGASYAIVDLTDAYRETASAAKRGYALINGRNAFLLQDEIKVKEPTEVYSFMHTKAKIEVASDGQSAVLTQKDKQMKVTLLSDCDAKLVDLPAEPFETTPEVNHENNQAWRKLTVKANVADSATFSVLFTPYYGEDQYYLSNEKIVPLKDWDAILEAPVPLTGIYLDGVLLADYKEGKTSYTLQEDRVGNVTAVGAEGVTVSVEQAEKLGDLATVTATQGDKTTVYVLRYANEVQEVLDSYKTYMPVQTYTSIAANDIKKLYDGNLATGWFNDGSHWVTYDLGSPKKVFEIEMLWDSQAKRQELFTIEVSNDNENWTRVWEGESILSNKMEKYPFDEVMAQYVKIHGISNPKSTWTSVLEIWVTSPGENFDDVAGDHWAALAINDMAKVGLVNGVAPGIYSPEAPLSRGAFVTMLARTYKLAKVDYSGLVPGIEEGAWYTPYVEAAYEQGLIPPQMLEGGFKPNQDITREEIAALAVTFYEKFKKPIHGASLERFADQGEISDWASGYIEKALALRLIAGITEDTFAPGAHATRAQAATILKRIYIKNA